MILITGAAGKTGRAVIRALVAQGQEVTAWVRRHEQVAGMAALGAARVVVGDLQDDAVLAQALAGVRAVYHIPPNMHPDELAIGLKLMRAARAAGVAHVVYHSVLHPQTEKMPHHWQKMRVEEALLEAGLDFTILQPAVYMENWLTQRDAISQGRYPVPYAAETQLSYVALADVAAAAAAVLTEGRQHVGATYELVGTPPLRQHEVAAVFAAALGHPVTVEVVSREVWRERAVVAGLSAYAVETLLAMFVYYEQFGLVGNPNVLRWLLGREPLTPTAFVQAHWGEAGALAR
ncbi:MAG: NmrA family NAD(P)-binding protein [Anaerolineae bacterium]|nr:NmrA family NAD(P)-binding protein [Caldilineales bacterium]MDW8269855.1 NmrA family NAD(P)-binding protein [Anaerolineae bacterium]